MSYRYRELVLLADSVVERNGTVVQILAGVLLTAGGGLVGWWFNRRRDRQAITLDYRILSDVAILSGHARPERLRIMFEENEVRNPFITEIELRNTGRTAIEKSQFLAPIEIYRPRAEILAWGIVKESVDHLADDITHNVSAGSTPAPDGITIQPETMNSGDYFVAQIIYDGDQSNAPIITSRILNESRPTREFSSVEPQVARANWILGSMLAITICAVSVITFFGPPPQRSAPVWFGLSALTFIGASWGLVMDIALRRRELRNIERL